MKLLMCIRGVTKIGKGKAERRCIHEQLEPDRMDGRGQPNKRKKLAGIG